MAENPPTQILTIREVASYLKLPVSTVYRLVERRELPGNKVGRQWRFQRGLIDDWLKQRSQEKSTTILVVDDDERVRSVLSETLEEKGRRVLTAANGSEALTVVASTHVNLVLLDLAMPGMDGVETFRQIRKRHADIPVVIITAYPDSDLMARAMEIGPFTILQKPVDIHQLRKIADLIAAG
ncbi:MAG TPA: response regulator [Methylomirabilota bacterium]|nr:response regulator [Methylomirabilota bacterium]